MSKITWYGHSAFKIESEGANVVIDPYFPPATGISWKEIGPVDLVLITHDHFDHVGSAVDICRATGAMLGCMVGTGQAMEARGVPEKQIIYGGGFNIGGTVECKGIRATMTQALHSSESGAPAGYIIRLPGNFTLYHAGDTGIFSSMRLFGELYDIDLALLPIGGIYTMDARQAALACKLVGCGQVIPMHWGTFPILAQSTDEFREKLAMESPRCECIGMEPGQTREIGAMKAI